MGARSERTRTPASTFDADRFDAVLFDLDGVLTDTARLHAACWKQAFDELLESLAEEKGEGFRPFDVETDYRRYVDGRSRIDGVRAFLASREIDLPEGSAGSAAAKRSIHGIARRKDELFTHALETEGPVTYGGAVHWLRRLRAAGLRTAVVSASHHCEEILRATSIQDLFDARVDGHVADRLALAGKPAPDTYLEAARRLEVEPRRAVVVEDALAGVRAGRAGGFGLVVGVSRPAGQEALSEAGADVVVSDLGEMPA
jgi:beta-phosphoglucomutase family hydrolase